MPWIIIIAVYVMTWLFFVYSALTAKYENELPRLPEETIGDE
jgi:hypothetical protein